MDPVYKESLSNYSTFANNPLLYTDPNGLDSINVHRRLFTFTGSDGATRLSYQEEEMFIGEKSGKDVFTYTFTHNHDGRVVNSYTEKINPEIASSRSNYGKGYNTIFGIPFERSMTHQEVVGAWMTGNADFDIYMQSRNANSYLWKAQYNLTIFNRDALPIITMSAASSYFGAMRASIMAANAAKTGLTSGQLGKIIGWGEGQLPQAVQQTINVTKNLTRSQVQGWAKQGLTKSWVQEQLTKYSGSLMKGGDKLKNTQLMHRKELMEKILELW